MAEILRMPEVAANTTEAILSSWLVDLNTPYTAGEAIVTVETDKAVVDVEAESDGVLLRLLVAEGATVDVGAPIAVWGAQSESQADVDELLSSLGVNSLEATSGLESTGPQVAGADEPEAEESVAAQAVESVDLLPAPEPAETNGKRLFASPLARKLAREAGLDLGTVAGSGPRGRIRKIDITSVINNGVARAASAPGPAAPAATRAPAPSPSVVPGTVGAAAFEDAPNSRLRQAIARRLTESKQTAPHFYLRGSARVDKLMALRREINDGAMVKVSINDLIVKAVGRAHALVPELNVQWNGDSIRHFKSVDVAVAVATEGGLVTPVVRGVEDMTLQRLVESTRDLVARAKTRRLQQSELEGGSISVTNLGMYGTEEFAAIINPPQAAILAVGAAREEAVVEDGQLVVGTVLRVTLAVDHRPVDGATAAEWMQTFVGLLENPAQILI